MASSKKIESMYDNYAYHNTHHNIYAYNHTDHNIIERNSPL